jgi:hypothetical protein
MKSAATVVTILVLFCSGVLAQNGVDFSGTYRLVSIKSENGSKKIPDSTLTISQREGVLERTSIRDGKTLVNHYTLDGKECKNVTSGGAPSTDKAQAKGKNIIIRSVVPLNAPPPASSSVVTTEKWELSKDSNTLTVHSKLEFPGMAMLDSSATEVYSRISRDPLK